MTLPSLRTTGKAGAKTAAAVAKKPATAAAGGKGKGAVVEAPAAPPVEESLPLQAPIVPAGLAARASDMMTQVRLREQWIPSRAVGALLYFTAPRLQVYWVILLLSTLLCALEVSRRLLLAPAALLGCRCNRCCLKR